MCLSYSTRCFTSVLTRGKSAAIMVNLIYVGLLVGRQRMLKYLVLLWRVSIHWKNVEVCAWWIEGVFFIRRTTQVIWFLYVFLKSAYFSRQLSTCHGITCLITVRLLSHSYLLRPSFNFSISLTEKYTLEVIKLLPSPLKKNHVYIKSNTVKEQLDSPNFVSAVSGPFCTE